MGFKSFYCKYYKPLLIIPVLILLLAFVQIAYQISTTGYFVNKGVSLKGGLSARISTGYNDVISLQKYLSSKFPDEDFDIRVLTERGVQTALLIEATSGVDQKELLNAIKEKLGNQVPPVDKMASEIGVVSSSFSESFFKTAIKAVLIAFVFMAIVVFYYFRQPIPSLAVILAAFSDIIVTVAVFNLLGHRLSTGGVAAFLMLIGYSVDTDILLSTRVLKNSAGTVFDRIWDSMGTGLLMSITTIAAAAVGYYFSQSETLKEIMLIILIGLFADIIMTWIQNAGILRWHLEKKGII